MTFRIFLGYDPAEPAAYHVLSHSILRHARAPVSIAPLCRESLPMLDRPRGEFDSTDFAISRFLVPHLCDYQGVALYMDCDMLMLEDICRLHVLAMANEILGDYDVQVVKHSYTPRDTVKFLGHRQLGYEKKNWSSLMLFNNAKCRALHPTYVNEAAGLDLHQFAWTDKIGALDAGWNNLLGEDCERLLEHSKCLHWTRGGPWFSAHRDAPHADLWRAEKARMNSPT